MKITKERFFAVGLDSKIAKDQLDAFWGRLERADSAAPSNAFSIYLYYLGAMIVISAMTWFMNLAWEQFGGGVLYRKNQTKIEQSLFKLLPASLRTFLDSR